MLTKIKRQNLQKVSQYLLDAFKIKNSRYYLSELIDSHVDYPSLLTLKDVLHEYGVESAALRKDHYHYRDFEMPFVCAIQQPDWDQALFTVITFVDEEELSYLDPVTNGLKILPISDFEQIDKNVVLLLDSEAAIDELDYKRHLKKQLTEDVYKRFPFLVFVFAAIVYSISSFNTDFFSLNLSYFAMTLVGLIIAFLLIWHDIDAHDPFFKEVCAGQGKKVNCNAVLSSAGASFLGISWSIWGGAYFLALFATQVLYGANTAFLNILFLSSIVVSPYILYSLFYQWKIVKQWCPLCLGIQVVLLVNLILSLVYNNHIYIFQGLTIYPLLIVFTIALTALVGLYYIVPLVKDARNSKNYEKKWSRLRYNPEVFQSLLEKNGRLEVLPSTMGIVIGNPDAKNEIIKVCNPYCGPCSKAHPELEKILSRNTDVKLRIVFTAYGNDSEKFTAPAKHILALQETYDNDSLKEAFVIQKILVVMGKVVCPIVNLQMDLVDIVLKIVSIFKAAFVCTKAVQKAAFTAINFKNMSNTTTITMFRFVLVLFFLLTVAAGIAQQPKPFTLKGTIDTAENAVYYFSYTVKDSKITDSVALGAGGSFEISGQITEPTRVLIGILDKYDPRVVGPFYVYDIWVDPGKVHMFDGEKDWKKGYKNYRMSHAETDSLARVFLNIPTDEGDESKAKFEFVKTHMDAYYSLYLLYGSVTYNRDFREVSDILPQLPAALRETDLYRKVNTMLTTKLGLQVGGKFPDFEMADTTGSILKLTDLNRGKYILVDFWASWCGPCRRENPYLVAAYDQYKEKGFDIIGVSLDVEKQRWLDAIQADSLLWHHVSDLKGFDNAVAKSLFIHSIPDNYLDPSGKIIARKIDGEDLQEILADIFD